MRRFCPLISKSVAPRSGLLQKSQNVSRTAFFVGAATRGECEGSASSKPKLRPEGGAPTEESVKALPAPSFCGRRAPRRMRRFCQLKSKSFAPRSGLLQKSQSAARAASVGAATPRRKRWFCQLKKQKLRPEVGPPTEEPKRRRAASVGGAPRGECGMCCHSKAKLRPEVGPPTRRAKASAAPLFVGGAPRGECGGSASSKQKLRPEVGPPTKEPKAPPAPLFLWEPRPAANADVLPAQSKSFAPRSGLLQKRQKRHSHRFSWEPRPAANQASEPLSRAAPRSVRRARRSRRRRAETGYARLVPRQPSEPRPRLPPAAFQGAIQ